MWKVVATFTFMALIFTTCAEDVPCKINVYTRNVNDGGNTTAGESSFPTENIVAVSKDVWDVYKHLNVTINGTEYVVRDQYTCGDSDFTIFVDHPTDGGMSMCSWVPTPRAPEDDEKIPNSPPDTSSHGGSWTSTYCTVTFYTSSPNENNGHGTAADGSRLIPSNNIAAVSTSMYRKLKHKKLRFQGKTYTVRDSCSSCNRGGRLGVDILVASKKEAKRLGIRRGKCEIKG